VYQEVHFLVKYTEFRNVLGMNNIKFPVTSVSVRARVPDESSVLYSYSSLLPSSVISGFCHDVNRLCAVLRNIPVPVPEQHRIITNKNDIEKLQKDLGTLGEWAVEMA